MSRLRLNYNIHFLSAGHKGVGAGSTTEQWMEAIDAPLQSFPAGWGGWETVRQAHVRLLEREATPTNQEILAEASKYKPGSRGVVCGAGGALFFSNALAMVSCLRASGSSLPVEFWHLGPHEMDNRMRSVAESNGVRVVDAREFCLRRGITPRCLNGWELKSFAMLHSQFEEVLYLDADCMPVQNPERLFEEERYQHHGAIFWPDLPPNDRPEWLPDVCWHNVGMPPQPGRDFESGQMLVDKRRCGRPLRVANWINQHSDWYYQFVFGDKSTFHLAWRKCGMPFVMPGSDAGWRHPCIVQHDLAGNCMFLHACQGKEHIFRGDLPNAEVAAVVAETAARRATQWSGRIYDWSEMSGTERSLAAGFAGVYTYRRDGSGDRALELLPDGSIGVGRADCERRWAVTLDGNTPCIAVIGSGHKGSEIAMFLAAMQPDGTFAGQWTAYERNACSLTKIGG